MIETAREKTRPDTGEDAHKGPRSLFSLAQDSLTVALLRVRGAGSGADAVLFGRIRLCRGVDLANLQTALPDSGLKAHTLRFLETAHPVHAARGAECINDSFPPI
jgi:hypothetical protein